MIPGLVLAEGFGLLDGVFVLDNNRLSFVIAALFPSTLHQEKKKKKKIK